MFKVVQDLLHLKYAWVCMRGLCGGVIIVVTVPRIRDAHNGFRRVAEHGFDHHVLHKDAWDTLKDGLVVQVIVRVK